MAKKKPVPAKKSEQERFSFQEKFIGILTNKNFPLYLAGFFFIAAAVISFSFHKVGDYGVETDFFWSYVPSAKEFLKGNIEIDPFRGPLYPIALGLFGFLLNDFFTAGILIGVLSGAFVVFFSFQIIKKIFNPIAAFFAVLILFTNQYFFQYCYSAGTDMFFNALALGSLFFFYKKESFSHLQLSLAALMGGLAYLTRYNGIFILSTIAIILFINFNNESIKERLKQAGLFLFVFILTITPWGIFTLIKKGSFFYNHNYKNLAYELHAKGEIGWDQFWFQQSDNYTSLSDVIFQDFGLFVSKMIENLSDHFLKDMEILMGWHIGVFTIIGLVFFLINNPLRPFNTKENGFVIHNITFFLLLLLVFYSERFSLFLIPFYAVFAVYPLFSIKKFSTAKLIPKALSYGIAIILVVVTISSSYSFNAERINSGPVEVKQLSDWYNANVPENEKGKKLAARKPHPAYYMDMEFVLFPMSSSYEEFIAELKKSNVDYLFFSGIEASFRPQFRFLLDKNFSHPALTPVIYYNYPPAVLYKVN